MSKPAQLNPKSKAVMEARGYAIGKTEAHNAWSGRKTDLFGLFDSVCIHAEHQGVLGLQVTSYTNITAHVKKALETPELATWLKAGNRAVIHGWVKPGALKKVPNPTRWHLVELEFGLAEGKPELVRRELLNGKGVQP